MNRPSLREAVGCAVNSSNLKSDDLKESSVDRVAAMASASELGSVLLRLKVGGDTTVLKRAAALLARLVREQEDPPFGDWTRAKTSLIYRICERVINEWLQDKCPKCRGRGRTGMGKGVVISSSVDCHPCAGSGRVLHVGNRTQAVLDSPEFGPLMFGAEEAFRSNTIPCKWCNGKGSILTDKSIKEASLGKVCTQCQGTRQRRINGAERARVVGVSPKNYWKTWDPRFRAIRLLVAIADGEAGEDIRTILRGARPLCDPDSISYIPVEQVVDA